jgi:RNA polymerase sigma factor (sigma-70 family)
MSQPNAQSEASALVRESMELYESQLIAYAATLLNGDLERARDVVQDTFLRLYLAEPEKVRENVKAWLYTVCRNRAFDVLRKDVRLTFAEDEVLHTYSDQRPDPSLAADTHELYDRAWELLESLSENQQEVIRLKFLHHHSYKDIARVTGLSIGNVGFLMHVGLKKLRDLLHHELNEHSTSPL